MQIQMLIIVGLLAGQAAHARAASPKLRRALVASAPVGQLQVNSSLRGQDSGKRQGPHEEGQFVYEEGKLPYWEARSPQHFFADDADLSEEPKKKMMDFINQFRAEVCGKMKEEHGRDFATYHKCKDFLEDVCNPGKDGVMDGDSREVHTGKGYCKDYFHVKKVEAELAKRASGDSQGPAPGPMPAPAILAPAPSVQGGSKGHAVPAPAPAALAPAPGLAPAPAPYGGIPGKSGGKPSDLKDDESWYFKKGGKSLKHRLHMDAKLKLPTQGYFGKLVEHEDKKTVTEDWGAEYAGNLDKYCRDHPGSPWCDKHKHSSGQKAAVSFFALLVTFLMAFASAHAHPSLLLLQI